MLKKIIVKHGITAIFTGMGSYLIVTHIKPITSFIIGENGLIKLILTILVYPLIFVQCRMIAALCYGKKYSG